MADTVETPGQPKIRKPQGTRAQAATAAPVETVGTQMAQAPPLFKEQFRQRLQNTSVTDQGGAHTALPIPLDQIDRDFGPLVASMKEVMQEGMKDVPPEEQAGYFYQGFQQYPEQMAQMLVRMAMNNRLRADNNVAKWMELVNQRFR